jgi:hypothetical protein
MFSLTGGREMLRWDDGLSVRAENRADFRNGVGT